MYTHNVLVKECWEFEPLFSFSAQKKWMSGFCLFNQKISYRFKKSHHGVVYKLSVIINALKILKIFGSKNKMGIRF